MLIATILLSVGLAAVAQLMLKHGMNQVNADLSPAKFGLDGASLRSAVTTGAVWVGLLLFGISAVVWLVVLSRVSLSFAYPFASLTYVLILLFDKIALHEDVSPLRWGGVALIAAGIFLVSRTAHG
jgi:drug/metabolite transporter (DMT)-like permease